MGSAQQRRENPAQWSKIKNSILEFLGKNNIFFALFMVFKGQKISKAIFLETPLQKWVKIFEG